MCISSSYGQILIGPRFYRSHVSNAISNNRMTIAPLASFVELLENFAVFVYKLTIFPQA